MPVIGYVVVLLVSSLVSSLAVPLALSFAHRRGLVDAPGGRKAHLTAVPRIGGIGILAGFLAGLLGAACLPVFAQWWNREATGILLGALMMFAVGLSDDLLHQPRHGAPEGPRREGLPAWAKLLLQVSAAAVCIAAGTRIRGVQVPGDGYLSFGAGPSAVVTALWIVGMANALNFIDGLDGLAGGVSMIMGATIAVIAIFGPAQSPAPAVFAVALFGGIVGFLRLNFPPASIFMGDGGANLLGYLLATMAVSGVMKGATAIAVLTPIVIMALPLLNLAGVVVGRVLRGDSPLKADRSHLHHRLQDAGWSDLSALLFVYAVCGLCGSAALALMELSVASAVMALAVALLLVGVASRRAGATTPNERPAPSDEGAGG